MATEDLQSLLKGDDPPSVNDENVLALQKDVERLRERSNEDRFIFLLVVVVAIDAHLFVHMTTWAAPLCIFALEIVGLVVMSRRCGVEDIQRLMDRLIDSWGKNGKDK